MLSPPAISKAQSMPALGAASHGNPNHGSLSANKRSHYFSNEVFGAIMSVISLVVSAELIEKVVTNPSVQSGIMAAATRWWKGGESGNASPADVTAANAEFATQLAALQKQNESLAEEVAALTKKVNRSVVSDIVAWLLRGVQDVAPSAVVVALAFATAKLILVLRARVHLSASEFICRHSGYLCPPKKKVPPKRKPAGQGKGKGKGKERF